MERWLKAAVAAAILLVVAAASFDLGYAWRARRDPTALPAGEGDEQGLDVVRDAYRQILDSAADPPDEQELARAAVRGMIDLLRRRNDPYALFYSREDYRDIQELTSGSFSGIGIWLKAKRGELTVVSVLPDTPALEAGLRPGDVILSIDGRSVTGAEIDEVVDAIKGPEGTEVSLRIERSGRSVPFTIERATLELPNVQSKLAGDFGYVRLFGFAHGAGDQLRSQISHLRRRGADGFVLDLRDNGGGLFSEAVSVASAFIEDGEITTYRRRGEEAQVFEARGDAYENVPLVVLVNEGTASASEVVAGALQDRRRAIVVGTRTYGKGSVQEVLTLRDASAVKLTTGAYFTPSGRSIDGKGIEPDVEVDGSPRAQRKRALQILRGIVLSAGEPGPVG